MNIDPITLAAFMAASVALYLTPGADMMYISASSAAGVPRLVGRRAGREDGTHA